MAKDHHVNLKLLGDRIRRLREESGLSTRDFAELCGISKSQVNDLEKHGSDIRYSTLQKMAAGFGMTVRELLNF